MRKDLELSSELNLIQKVTLITLVIVSAFLGMNLSKDYHAGLIEAGVAAMQVAKYFTFVGLPVIAVTMLGFNKNNREFIKNDNGILLIALALLIGVIVGNPLAILLFFTA